MSSIWSRLINLAGNITGILPVANGGTGLASGTSGGVPYYSGATTIASSGALTQHAVVVGGGAGNTPLTIAAGTNGQLLVGSTSADPAFGSTVSAATTFSGGVVFNGGGTNLNYYETGTFSTSFGNPFNATQTPTFKYTRIGNTVTLRLTVVNAAATSPTPGNDALTSGSLPASIRPSTSVTAGWILGRNAGALDQVTNYRVDLSSNGNIEIIRTASWTATTNCGWAESCVTYDIN